jgi:membrane fusion protein (multidrug efflux system)
MAEELHAPESEAPRIVGFTPALPGDNGRPQDGQKYKANEDQRPFYKRPWVIAVAAVFVLAVILGGGAYWLHRRHFEWTDDAFIDGRVVQISPKVAGYLAKLLVDDNQLVGEGQVLLEVDPRDYEAALEQARATEALAVGKRKQAEAQVAASIATAKAAQAVATSSPPITSLG